MVDIVYMNGEFIPRMKAATDISDRGYLFSDGVYEVISVYHGKAFKMLEHFERLQESARAIEINDIDYKNLLKNAEELLARSSYDNAKLYIQITRGTEPRNHAYSDDLTPNTLMTVSRLKVKPEKFHLNGVKTITIPDERWVRCNIKTISLLPNILGKKQAQRAGAFEAIQVRDGFITDGTSSNVFIVKQGVIITPPATNYILNGITRQVIITEIPQLGYEVSERSIHLDEIYEADEVFLTGTTTEVMPVVEVDNKLINKGQPGEISINLFKKYRQLAALE